MVDENTEKNGDMLPQVVYQPEYKETQLTKFQKYVEEKFSVRFDDYWKLHEWSCRNFPEFWECVWQFFGIISSKPYTEVFDRKRSSFANMEWFKGARLNYAENIFKYKDSHIALIALNPSNNEEYITYRQLYEEVCQYALALRDLGVKKGDLVGCYMTNKLEAVYAFLATASIGAIWCGSHALQGAKAVLARFQQLSLKVLFTSGNFFYHEKEIKMMEKLKTIAEGLSSLEKVVFVPSKTQDMPEDISHIPKCCTLENFLDQARTKFNNSPWELEYEQVPFDCPLTISFTSGTTGLPKGIIHSTGAFFAALKDSGLHQDITRKDVLFNASSVGWISWNMYVNTLHLGMTLCMYEGFPFEETPTRFWDLVDKFGITSSPIATNSAENMEKNGYVPTENHSLKTLKHIFPLGSILKPNTYEFFPKVKPGVFIQSFYGMTEFFGAIGGVNCSLPVYKGEIHCFCLGMDVKCLNETGEEVIGERGRLVLANPYPAMPISLLHDEDKKKVREIYLEQYPGYWYTGDDFWINPITKGFMLYGRCDETLNPKGARFNCSEIYYALDNFPGILDCVCASHYNKQLDERAVLFVKMKPGISLTEKVKDEIMKVIEDDLSCERVPDLLIQVPDIPYNVNGKKVNLVVKQLINKMPVPNAEFIANPESMEFYKQLDLGEF